MPENKEYQVAAYPSRHLAIWLDFLIPIALLALFAIFVDAKALDLSISSRWYHSELGWPWGKNLFCELIYKYGTWPALGVAIYGLYAFIRSFFDARFKGRRKIFLYLVLVMIIGPGLVVNTALKQQWGRPRPRRIQEFGGKHRYEAPWQMDKSSPGNSFPSGHASMGFYFLTLHFLSRRKGWRKSFWIGLLAIAWGAVIGLVRIMQGGHFFTDVLWSLAIVWFISALLYYSMGLHKEPLILSTTIKQDDNPTSSS